MGPFCPLYSFPPEPGLYWYHPHAHTLAEAQMLGGATGALVVGGIQNYQPAVVGLPERLIVVRDNLLPAGSPPPELPSCPTCFDGVPSWDLTVNYVPVSYPTFTPATVRMRPGATEFWRSGPQLCEGGMRAHCKCFVSFSTALCRFFHVSLSLRSLPPFPTPPQICAYRFILLVFPEGFLPP